MTAAAALDDYLFLPPSFYLTDETAALKSAGAGVWRNEELPYEFGMCKTEDEFFASLSQRLTLSESRKVLPQELYKSPEGLKMSGGSPQSTLGGVGSWSGRSSNGSSHCSPPATPFESFEDTLGLIYEAAGQVARLERNAEDQLQAAQWRAVAKPDLKQQTAPIQNRNDSFHADQLMKLKYMAAVRQANKEALIWENHLQNIIRSELLTQPEWPALQQARVHLKPNYQAVPLQRKESAGTGVFIPRRYDTPPSVPPRKRAVAPCALVPAKVVQALNTSIGTMSPCSQPQCSPVPTTALFSQHSYDALMARRRALLDQQQISTSRNDDIASRSLEACLPQEWSY